MRIPSYCSSLEYKTDRTRETAIDDDDEDREERKRKASRRRTWDTAQI